MIDVTHKPQHHLELISLMYRCKIVSSTYVIHQNDSQLVYRMWYRLWLAVYCDCYFKTDGM